jgi:hypothetical protein
MFTLVHVLCLTNQLILAGDFRFLEPPAAPAPLGILIGYIAGMMKHVTITEHELAAGTTSVDPENVSKIVKILEDQVESQT